MQNRPKVSRHWARGDRVLDSVIPDSVVVLLQTMYSLTSLRGWKGTVKNDLGPGVHSLAILSKRSFDTMRILESNISDRRERS